MKIKRGSDIIEENYIKWFSELSNKDIAIAGGKGASLSEMFNSGFPVPPGFIVTAQAFEHFIAETNLKEKIKEILEKTDLENTKELNESSEKIRNLIETQNLPKEMENGITEAYRILSSEKIDSVGVSQDAINILKNSQELIFVSVRSSATTEDLADASFAGQQESFLNIKGERELIEHIKKCFSSLYTPRAIYYRCRKGFKESESLLAVVIQKMVDSIKSGVVFSKDPVNLNDNIVIEAVFGLGEGIVSGRISPDSYIVSRDMEIKETKIIDKKIAIVRTSSGENAIIKLSNEKSRSQVLTENQIFQLARYAIKLEEHYEKPQDIEFAIDSEKIYIVQSRPITTLNKEKKSVILKGNILVEGLGSSPGIGVGVVKIIKDLKDLDKIKKGDVLVTEMTNPDMVVAMQKCIAIVTDEGGVTAHASIVSRELGIPCVVGTGNATSALKDGIKITVDGTNGKVYEGEVAETSFIEIKPALETKKIKLKLIVDLPESAERALQSGIAHVGLLRLEGIIAGSGKHPLQYEKEENLEEYTKLLRNGIEKISQHFSSIWIRTSDIRTDEFELLEGAPKKEINPMLGLHGIRFSLKHLKIFEAELLAIKEAAEKNPDKNFGVMFPQIISAEEVKKSKEHFNEFKLDNMQIGVMIETPAAAQIIESICREGIDFISLGTNDLTQFTLAVDRGEEDVQYLYNELHPSIFSQIKRVLWMCKKYRIETSICGQAGSKKEMIEFLFRNGINSISVNADAAYEASVLINELERQREEFLKNNPNWREQKRNRFRNRNKFFNKNKRYQRDNQANEQDNRGDNQQAINEDKNQQKNNKESFKEPLNSKLSKKDFDAISSGNKDYSKSSKENKNYSYGFDKEYG